MDTTCRPFSAIWHISVNVQGGNSIALLIPETSDIWVRTPSCALTELCTRLWHSLYPELLTVSPQLPTEDPECLVAWDCVSISMFPSTQPHLCDTVALYSEIFIGWIVIPTIMDWMCTRPRARHCMITRGSRQPSETGIMIIPTLKMRKTEFQSLYRSLI